MRELQTRQGAAFYAFFVGDVLVKAEEVDGKWLVFLEASNENLDQDEEIVLQKALKEVSGHYLTHGVISWDHKHKIERDPSYIIGEPTEVAFPTSRQTLVKGFLYKENKRAQAIWDNLRSGTTRFGASVGGYILNKSDQTHISKVYWDEVAITYKPINDTVLGQVSLVPFKQFAKALMAGGGVDAAQFEGGRALIPESLQGSAVKYRNANKLPTEELNGLFGDLFKAIKDGKVTSHGDLISFVNERGYEGSVAAELIQFVSSKLPEAVGSLRR